MQSFFDKSGSKPKQTTQREESDQLKNSDSKASIKITSSLSFHEESSQLNKEPPEQFDNQNYGRSKRSSPRSEISSSAKTLRKLSAGGRDNKSLSKEHTETSEEGVTTKSKTSSPSRDRNKEFSNSDPTDSAPFTSKLSRNKVSHGETKKTENEYAASDSVDVISLRLYRKKSPGQVDHSDSTISSKSRHSSPRRELKKSGKDQNIPKELVQDEKNDNTAVNSPKIKKNDKGSISSEYEGEPELFFPLNLQTIISERTDSSFHGRTGAYSDTTLQLAPKTRKTYTNRMNFMSYCKYITDEMNALQRKKFEIIQSLVAVIDPSYAMQKQTEKNHKKFCRDLIEIIECCMRTSLEACAKSKYCPDINQAPTEKISLFWKSIPVFIIKFEEEHQIYYDQLLNELIENLNMSFTRQEQLQEFKNQKCNRPSDENPLCCISWDYLNVLCDSHFISGTNLEQFKNFYNEHCHGVASEFIFLPHMWDFIRQILDKESRHHSPYHDTLKKLDNLLQITPVFADFKPETKSYIKSVLHF